MSGYCPDCGNTMCVCSDLEDDGITLGEADVLASFISYSSYERLKQENAKLKELLIQANWYAQRYSILFPNVKEFKKQYNELMGEESKE